MSAQHDASRQLGRQAGGPGPVARFEAYSALREVGAGPARAFNAAFRAQAARVLAWVLAFISTGGVMLLAAWMAAQGA